MNKPIERSNGITESERYLQKLCEKSFLRLWCYPGVYRDQTAGRGAKGGKEVCDLLVVFENHIIIFSDKSLTFPNTGNIDIDWSRWVRKAVLESGEQIYGAERWIKNHPDRLFIDPKCQQIFPIDIPNPQDAIFHRIIVAHGASERCKRELGGYGSLQIISSIKGEEHLLTRAEGGVPFAIGQVDPTQGYIHIFDDASLDIVMKTLDTVSDFTSYLKNKELLIKKRSYVITTGEEELLAFYLGKTNKNGEHDFIIPNEVENVEIKEGFWQDFINSIERVSQIEADKISYFWDSLIEKLNYEIFNDSLQFSEPKDIRNLEKGIRLLAREPRIRRRILSKGIQEFIKKTPDVQATRIFTSLNQSDPIYLFLQYPQQSSESETSYRKDRTALLMIYLMVLKHEYPKSMDFLGIATETGTNAFHSEDFIYLNARAWTADDEITAIQYQKELDLLQNTIKKNIHENEYPISTNTVRQKHHRHK